MTAVPSGHTTPLARPVTLRELSDHLPESQAVSLAPWWPVHLGSGDSRHRFKVRFLKQISYSPCNF